MGAAGAEFKWPSTCVGRSAVPVYDTTKCVCKATRFHVSDDHMIIPKSAFAGCSALTKITGMDNVESVGDAAFSGCKSLRRFAWPPKARVVYYGAFVDCSALTVITGMDNVEHVGPSAFSGCNSLTRFAWPPKAREVKSSAFAGCSALTEITGMDNVESVGEAAFSGCKKLPHVYLPTGCQASFDAFSWFPPIVSNERYSIGEHFFYGTHRSAFATIHRAALSPVTLVRKNPIDVAIAMEVAQLAYEESIDAGVTLRLGTVSAPFSFFGTRCRAELTVRRFFKSSALEQIQKVIILAEVHEGSKPVRRLLVIGFRGTVDLTDAVLDVSIGFDKGTFANEELNAHGGFASAVSDPRQHAELLESLYESIENIDGLLFTGHSLGGATAQVASLHARKIYGMLKAFEVPSQRSLRPIFKKLFDNPTKREGVLALLNSLRCITFEAPTPFAPVHQPQEEDEQRAACSWLTARAINYVCGTDLVPLLPQHLNKLLDSAEALADAHAIKLVAMYNLYQDFQGRPGWRPLEAVIQLAQNATRAVREQCAHYTPLAATIFLGPEEPSQGTAFTRTEEIAAHLRQRLAKLTSNGSVAAFLSSLEWHRMDNVAPYVRASVGLSNIARWVDNVSPYVQAPVGVSNVHPHEAAVRIVERFRALTLNYQLSNGDDRWYNYFNARKAGQQIPAHEVPAAWLTDTEKSSEEVVKDDVDIDDDRLSYLLSDVYSKIKIGNQWLDRRKVKDALFMLSTYPFDDSFSNGTGMGTHQGGYTVRNGIHVPIWVSNVESNKDEL